MSKSIRNLALLFAAQAVLVAVVWSFSGASGEKKDTAFLEADLTQANKVVIDSDDGKVVLSKQEAGWTLPEYGNLDVVKDKLENALDKLSSNNVRWPAATSEAAQERFEVSNDNAQKTITFFKDDKEITTVRLGTSPGYRKVNARVDDKKEVYAINFAQHELPGKSEEWFNRSRLKFEGTIDSVKADGFQLNKDEDGWKISKLPEGKVLDEKLVQDWVDNFTRLVVSSRVSSEDVEKIIVQNPALTVEVSGKDENDAKLDSSYVFYKSGETFYVKRFGEEHLFVIAKYSAEPIIDVKPENFEAESADSAEGSQSDIQQ